MSKTKILIIDDEPDICEVTQSILRKRGYTCCGALNKTDALAAIAREKPDIVLMDVNLGDDSGIELIPELLALHGSARIVMVSGALDHELVEQAKEKGAIDFLTKPFSSAFLTEFINKLAAAQ